jgi:hypothetical protein
MVWNLCVRDVSTTQTKHDKYNLLDDFSLNIT